jgi:hypothetical protein
MVSGVVVVTAAFAGVVVLLGAPGAASAGPRSLRPVAPRLLRYLSEGPIAFRPAGPDTRPGISAAVASRDAVREVQWRPASAKGISLVRLESGTGGPSGTLTWLVALKPRHPLYDGRGGSRGPAADFMAAFIRARDGRFLGDAAGYSPQLVGRAGGSGWGMAERSPPG